VGSIAAGGRYDDLVGMFTSAAAAEGRKGPGLPCVGVSIGLDRVFAIIWPKWVEKGMRSKETMVYVIAAGDGLLEERIELVQELRAAGIKVCRSLSLFFFGRSRRLSGRFPGQEQAKTASAIRSW
jgi:histidyl-tRNA synthetase